MKKETKQKGKTVMDFLEIATKVGNDMNTVLTAMKIAVLKTYSDLNTAEQTIPIQEYDFTMKGDKAIVFEYWTNSDRSQGYQSIDISELNINVTELLTKIYKNGKN